MGKAAAESAPARSIVGKVPTMARFRNLAAVALIHHSDMNELRTQINNERGLQWSRGTHPHMTRSLGGTSDHPGASTEPWPHRHGNNKVVVDAAFAGALPVLLAKRFR